MRERDAAAAPAGVDASDSNGCFVCGPGNPIGLRVRFRREGDLCLGEFVPQPEHAGYDQVTHGGLLFALLDDVMANWLWLEGSACFTARADIRYREPLPIGTPVALLGRCTRRRGRLAEMTGRIEGQNDGVCYAEGAARFMIRNDTVRETGV